MRRRIHWFAGLLSLVGVVALAIAPTVPGFAAAASDEEVQDAIDERGWFGLEGDRDYVSRLIEQDPPRIPGWPGLVVTPQEANSLDLDARAGFAVAVEEAVVPYLDGVDGFGGLWFDQAHGGRLVVALTSDESSTREEVAFRMPRESLGPRFEEVDFTQAELRKATAKVDEAWSTVIGVSEPVSFGVSIRDNAVTIGVNPGDWDRVTKERAAELRDRIGVRLRFRIEKQGADLVCDNRDSCGTVHPGVLVHYNTGTNGKSCSTGFIIRKSTANPPIQILTAGHCDRIYVSGAYQWTSQKDWYHGGSHIGDFESHDLYHSGGIDVGRIGIDDGASAVSEQIFGETPPYDIVQELGTHEGEALCTSLAQTDDQTSSDGMKCGIVRNVETYWTSESGPWRVHGSALNLSGSNGPIDGDSGSPVYLKYDNDAGHRRHPVGVVDHEFIPCGQGISPGEPSGSTNHCGRDLYFGEIKATLEEWSTWSIWTG